MEVLSVMNTDSIFKKPSQKDFWRRQFADQVSRPQVVFDVLVGIVAPILCFAFDPFVFRGGLAGPPLLDDYQLPVYFFSGLQIIVLGLWLLDRAGVQVWNELVGFGLLVGGMFCITIGLVLLPFSVMGLMLGIGIFGFTPFLTGIVYLRNGVRALRSPRTDTSIFTRAFIALLGSLLVIGAPLLLAFSIHQTIASSIDDIVRGDPSQASAAVSRLGPLKYLVGSESNKIVSAYLSTSDPSRKQLLKSCYLEITGEDIERRVAILQD